MNLRSIVCESMCVRMTLDDVGGATIRSEVDRRAVDGEDTVLI